MSRRRDFPVKRPQGWARLAEWGKNLLIAVLAVSAVYLALRTGLYTSWVERSSSFFGALGGQTESAVSQPVSSADPAQPGAAARPVRMAVHDGAGRFGAQYDAAQTDTLYSAFSSLLGEALSSASGCRTVSESVWRQALGQPGVYLEFPGAVPLSALRSWLSNPGSGQNELSGEARRLLLALGDGDAVVLYYHNEADGMYYACDTAVSYVGHLKDAVAGYTANGATFVFEYGPDSGYEALDPYVMVLSSPPSPRVYHAATPISLEDEDLLNTLQRALSFSSQTSTAYTVPDALVVRDGNDTLRVREDGTVTVHVGETVPRYPAEEDTPSALIEVCRSLTQSTVGLLCGEATLSFTSLTAREDGGWEVRFSYLLNGTPVQLGDEGYAAWFLIQGGQITDISLHFRSYEDTGEQSIVLRELRAAAAMEALDPDGRELILCYEDSGGERVSAGWIAR